MDKNKLRARLLLNDSPQSVSGKARTPKANHAILSHVSSTNMEAIMVYVDNTTT